MVTSGETFVAVSLAAVCLAIFAACVFLYFKKRDTRPLSFSDILVFLNWVDIEGLRKLIDPMEEAFLRQSHTRVDFGQIQEARIEAAREYFRKMVANATALQSFGYRHLGGGDDTRRLLAHRLINFAVPVKMCGRSGIFVLFLWRRFRVLRHFLISISLPDLKDLVEQTLEAYQELKEAALVLARYSEQGIETQLFSRL